MAKTKKTTKAKTKPIRMVDCKWTVWGPDNRPITTGATRAEADLWVRLFGRGYWISQ